jgi:hypothetical protein
MSRPYVPDGLPIELKKREGEALKRIWDIRRPMSQAAFAVEVLGLSAGILPQFFSGMRPLRIEIAEKFAAALGCSVADFSARLAQEASQSRSLVRWPFESVTLSDVAALAPHELILAEAALRARIVELRAARTTEQPVPTAPKGALQRRRGG